MSEEEEEESEERKIGEMMRKTKAVISPSQKRSAARYQRSHGRQQSFKATVEE